MLATVSDTYRVFPNDDLGPLVDALLDEGITASDSATANEKFQEAQEVLLKDLPAIPLWYSTVNGGYGENVSNVVIDWHSVPLYYEITKN